MIHEFKSLHYQKHFILFCEACDDCRKGCRTVKSISEVIDVCRLTIYKQASYSNFFVGNSFYKYHDYWQKEVEENRLRKKQIRR